MLYDFTNLTNSGSFIDIMRFLQFTVGIPLAQILVLIVFTVAFMSLKTYDTMKAFMASMVAVVITTSMLWAIDLLGKEYVEGSAVVLAVCVVIVYFWER